MESIRDGVTHPDDRVGVTAPETTRGLLPALSGAPTGVLRYPDSELCRGRPSPEVSRGPSREVGDWGGASTTGGMACRACHTSMRGAWTLTIEPRQVRHATRMLGSGLDKQLFGNYKSSSYKIYFFFNNSPF